MSVARVGDILGKGGLLTFPFSPDVTANGRPVALMGCIYTPHVGCGVDKRHCIGPTFPFPAGVTVNGLFPITKGCYGLCLDKVMTGSDDVIIVGGIFAQIAGIVGLASSAAGIASKFA
jgi:hypothetical protein